MLPLMLDGRGHVSGPVQGGRLRDLIRWLRALKCDDCAARTWSQPIMRPKPRTPPDPGSLHLRASAMERDERLLAQSTQARLHNLAVVGAV